MDFSGRFFPSSGIISGLTFEDTWGKALAEQAGRGFLGQVIAVLQ